MSIIFPKPLPTLIKNPEPDEYGFTAVEKIALKNCWRCIKRHQRKHARNIFLDFYTEHEFMLDNFRDKNNGQIKMSLLHSHPESILRIYDRLIEECLDNPPMFHVILTEVARRHAVVWPPDDYLEIIGKKTEAIEVYIKKELQSIASPTLYVALKKLSKLIQYYNKNSRPASLEQ